MTSPLESFWNHFKLCPGLSSCLKDQPLHRHVLPGFLDCSEPEQSSTTAQLNHMVFLSAYASFFPIQTCATYPKVSSCEHIALDFSWAFGPVVRNMRPVSNQYVPHCGSLILCIYCLQVSLQVLGQSRTFFFLSPHLKNLMAIQSFLFLPQGGIFTVPLSAKRID